MTLKFSQNAKVTCALASRSPVRRAADDDFEIVVVLQGTKKRNLRLISPDCNYCWKNICQEKRFTGVTAILLKFLLTYTKTFGLKSLKI